MKSWVAVVKWSPKTDAQQPRCHHHHHHSHHHHRGTVIEAEQRFVCLKVIKIKRQNDLYDDIPLDTKSFPTKNTYYVII